MGFDVLGVSGEERFHGKYFCGFIALIIRNEIINLFERYGQKTHRTIDTNSLIGAFSNDIYYSRSREDYVYAGKISRTETDILKELDISLEDVKRLGEVVGSKLNITMVNRLRLEKRVIPPVEASSVVVSHKQTKGETLEDDQMKHRQTDQSCNSINKESSGNPSDKIVSSGLDKSILTNESQDEEKAQIVDETAEYTTGQSSSEVSELAADQQKHGRKKGTKNKKTLQREAEEKAERERRVAAGLPPEEPKPGRGRKKGSKNKKTLEREAAEQAERERRVAAGLPPEEPKPGRGRRKGSKNKKTLEREAAEMTNVDGETQQELEVAVTSRVGMKYRPTMIQEEFDKKLSEKTGIDIIGNPPPRPWSPAVRYAETKKRKMRREEAKRKLKEIEASKEVPIYQ